MGTPNTPHDLAVDDRLAEIDALVAVLRHRDEESADQAAGLVDRRRAFLDYFHQVCDEHVRPAMHSVIDRLRAQDGDGLIEEHPGGEPRVATPRLTLWMSLQGGIEGAPRQDRHPYLQLDADVANERIRLTEGDSRSGRSGGSSGTGSWAPDEVTRTLVIDEVLAVLRRAAGIPAGAGAP